MEPKVVFEDEEILVLDKPSGMTVNRAETTKGEETVEEWLERRITTGPVPRHLVGARYANKRLRANKASGSGHPSYDEFHRRLGIVHRIDKETSGVLIVAKNPSAFANLQGQFKERGVGKTYVALVHGEVKPREGEIRVPVGRLPWNRKRFGVVAGGREAVTKYRVLEYPTSHLSLLEIHPETGRTHQIRVHLKYAGYPIFADPLYAGRKTGRIDRKLLPRLFLHASKISFDHPKTGERVSFESPLPSELDQFLRSLGANKISPGR